MTTDDSVTITLTKDEAIVLYEIVGDFRDGAQIPIRDQAERRAFWNLTCTLEKAIQELFSPRYGELVEIAKKNLSH